MELVVENFGVLCVFFQIQGRHKFPQIFLRSNVVCYQGFYFVCAHFWVIWLSLIACSNSSRIIDFLSDLSESGTNSTGSSNVGLVVNTGTSGQFGSENEMPCTRISVRRVNFFSLFLANPGKREEIQTATAQVNITELMTGIVFVYVQSMTKIFK